MNKYMMMLVAAGLLASAPVMSYAMDEEHDGEAAAEAATDTMEATDEMPAVDCAAEEKMHEEDETHEVPADCMEQPAEGDMPAEEAPAEEGHSEDMPE